MRIMKFVLAMALVIALAGCRGSVTAGSGDSEYDSSVAESLEPLYSQNNVIYDPWLEGDWLFGGDTDKQFHIAPAGNRAYRVTIDGEPSILEVHLLRLGSNLLLDAVPVEWPAQSADLETHLDWAQTGVELAPALIRLEDNVYLETKPAPVDNSGVQLRIRIRPSHIFFRLSRSEQTMELEPLSGNWVADGVKNGSLRIDHVMAEKQPVLSAITADLQKLVVENESDPAVFGSKLSFQKRK